MNVPPAIGRYPVIGLLGTGAFSAVYRAIDERLGTDVAIKLLGDHHSLDPEIRERFIAEARLLRRVNSPHVVRLYDLDETDRHQPFHVLEFVAGGNLWTQRKLMTSRGRSVTALNVVAVVTAVTDALTALHDERIVHRDLTPSNLLLRRGSDAVPADDGLLADGEQLVLADLGLSKDLSAASGLTAAGGTDGFAAPEQRETGTVDERTDVYAASALVTWLLLGHPPRDSDASELGVAGWPDSLAGALAAGLAQNPARRPASILEWRDAALGALAPPAPALRPPAPQTMEGAALAAPRSRRWLLTAGATAVVGGGVGYTAASIVDGDDGDGAVATVSDIGNGRVRIERSSSGTTAAMEGPAQLVVGVTATINARVSDGAPWAWIGQGKLVPNAPVLAITPTTSGVLAIALVAASPDGRAVVVDGAFDVIDAPAG